MRQILITCIFLLFGQISIGQISIGQVNPEWRQQDLDLINGIIKLDKNNPKEVESFFNRNGDKYPKDTLGFGWTTIERGIAPGYITIRAYFFYYKDTIKTYILRAELPYQKEIIEEYKSLYSKFLQIDTGKIYLYKYKEQNILKPLNEFSDKEKLLPISKKLLEYMAPTSGNTYGFAGGFPVTILQNRRLFNQLEDSLTIEQVIIMMYSINPVSRLTAIEYYLKNKTKFKNSTVVDNWIENVYNEVPIIETISGCFMGRENAKTLVEQFAKAKFD